jgi:hypothetical protein
MRDFCEPDFNFLMLIFWLKKRESYQTKKALPLMEGLFIFFSRRVRRIR